MAITQAWRDLEEYQEWVDEVPKVMGYWHDIRNYSPMGTWRRRLDKAARWADAEDLML